MHPLKNNLLKYKMKIYIANLIDYCSCQKSLIGWAKTRNRWCMTIRQETILTCGEGCAGYLMYHILVAVYPALQNWNLNLNFFMFFTDSSEKLILQSEGSLSVEEHNHFWQAEFSESCILFGLILYHHVVNLQWSFQPSDLGWLLVCYIRLYWFNKLIKAKSGSRWAIICLSNS